jgi:hypothetical protein|tara:strand:- start:219 stop:428 length:210 start_codon:yes stop_codon:yes gene_type:complete
VERPFQESLEHVYHRVDTRTFCAARETVRVRYAGGAWEGRGEFNFMKNKNFWRISLANKNILIEHSAKY